MTGTVQLHPGAKLTGILAHKQPLTDALPTNKINIMFKRNCIMLTAVIISLILPACESKQENPVNVYLGGKKSARSAADAANLDALRKSVEAYRAANGSYPDSLKDLEGMLGSRLDFSRYDYDPQTGTVTLKTQ
jgi:hypothetical protein